MINLRIFWVGVEELCAESMLEEPERLAPICWMFAVCTHQSLFLCLVADCCRRSWLGRREWVCHCANCKSLVQGAPHLHNTNILRYGEKENCPQAAAAAWDASVYLLLLLLLLCVKPNIFGSLPLHFPIFSQYQGWKKRQRSSSGSWEGVAAAGNGLSRNVGWSFSQILRSGGITGQRSQSSMQTILISNIRRQRRPFGWTENVNLPG